MGPARVQRTMPSGRGCVVVGTLASMDRSPRPERVLIAAVQSGDRAAIEELLERHERQIYRFGLRMCGNEDDARDVLQETMLAAFRSLTDFRGDAELSTWLFQIARSFCIKERRRERPTGPLDEAAGEIAETSAGPEARAHAHEIGTALAVAIAGLPPEQREVVVLRDVEGLGAEQAAHVVGIEVGALKSRLHRARQELRSRLLTLLGEDVELGAPPPCPELAQALSRSAEIDQATCASIEEHLVGCPRCAGACDALKRTVSMCRSIPGNEVPPSVRAAVRHAIRDLTFPP